MHLFTGKSTNTCVHWPNKYTITNLLLTLDCQKQSYMLHYYVTCQPIECLTGVKISQLWLHVHYESVWLELEQVITGNYTPHNTWGVTAAGQACWLVLHDWHNYIAYMHSDHKLTSPFFPMNGNGNFRVALHEVLD